MKHFTRLLALGAILFSSTVVLAQSEAKEKARELMDLMALTDQLDATFEQMAGFADQMVDAQNLPPAQAQEAKALANQAMEASMSRIKQIDFGGMFADIYASVFTAEEIGQLVDFYKSPIGKKFTEKQPQIMAATMQRMQAEMGKIMPQMQADIQAAIQKATSEDE